MLRDSVSTPETALRATAAAYQMILAGKIIARVGETVADLADQIPDIRGPQNRHHYIRAVAHAPIRQRRPQAVVVIGNSGMGGDIEHAADPDRRC